MRRIILIGCIFSLFHIQSAVSQIDVDIKNYVDSTEILVRNGRKMLIESIQKNDYQKADEIFEYLSDLSKSLHCKIFGYYEEMNIAFLLEKWDLYLNCAKQAIEYPYGRAMRYYGHLSNCYYNTSDYLESITLSVMNDKVESLIYNAMNDSRLTQEAKDFIYLSPSRFLVSMPDYDTKYKDFKKNYPHSEYTRFLKMYLREPEFKCGMTFGVGLTSLFPDGKLEEYFPQGIGGHFSIDFNWKKLYFSLFVDGGSQKVKKDITIPTHYYTFDFKQGDKFSYTDAGLTMGYMLIRSNWIHIAPTIKIGGGSITSKIFKNSDDEYSIYDSFTFSPGLHTEWKICELGQRSNIADDPISYLSIKLDGGYNFITSYNYPEAKGNLFYARLGLVLGIGVF